MDEKYIVAPNRSISTNAGIKKAGDEISAKVCGSNFNKLVSLGWIIKEVDLKFKNDVLKSEMQLAKPERKEIEPNEAVVKSEKKEKRTYNKKIEFGAKKIDEIDEVKPEIKTEEKF